MRFAALLALAALAPAADFQIRGTVVDAITNKPIHGARVALSFWKESGFVHRGALAIFTGKDGGFRFTGVPEGDFELLAFQAGYIDINGVEARVPSIRLPSGAGKEFTLRLTPTGELTVTVRDEHGVPLGGAQVRIERNPSAGSRFGSLQTADSAGQCVFVAPAGPYRVTALGPGSATLLRARGLTFLGTANAEWVEVPAVNSVQTEIRVKPIPSRKVHLSVDTPGGATQCTVLSPQQRPDDYAVQWGLCPFQPGARVVEITGLPPGAYRLAMGAYEKAFQIQDADLNLAITPADRKY